MNENEIESKKKDYIAYEYKELSVRPDQISFYLDCYECFGWEADETPVIRLSQRSPVLKLKRDRKIVNKAELTRLQKNFEACVDSISMMEKGAETHATVAALIVGIIGTAFMAGAAFAIVAEQPIVWLCILLSIPGFACWILPYFIYKMTVRKQKLKVQPLIEEKHEEIFSVCEKGHSLL